MSQGSNYKKQVMEALFNAPTNLINNKAVMWAASNLPDEGGQGVFKTKSDRKIDHDADTIWDALGYSTEEVEKIPRDIVRLYANYMKETLENGTRGLKKSVVLERVFNCDSDDLKKYLIIFSISKLHDDLVEKAQELLINELSDEEKAKFMKKDIEDVSDVEGIEGLLKALKKFIDRYKDGGGEK